MQRRFVVLTVIVCLASRVYEPSKMSRFGVQEAEIRCFHRTNQLGFSESVTVKPENTK